MASEDKTEKPKDIADFIVYRPWTIMTLLFWLMMATWIPGMQLKSMQKQLRLSGADKNLIEDFSKRAVQAHTNYYLLWCKGCALAEHEEYLEDQGRVLRVLQKVKEREHSCRDITWSTPEEPEKDMTSKDYWDSTGTVAMISIDLGQTPDKCSHFMGGYLRGIRGQESGDVHGGLASALSLMEGSMAAVGEEVTRHQLILVPLMLVLLYNVVGGGWRATTPIFMFMWSASSSNFVLLMLKKMFDGLEVGFMANTIPFVCLAFCVDYGIFFWTRFDKERSDRPAKEDYLDCVAEALRKSGEVIICSTVVMMAAYFSAVIYPSMNEYGYLAMCLQLAAAIFFCGFYSVLVVPCWAAAMPSLYDNREPGSKSCFAPCLPTMMTNLPESTKFWRTWAGIATRGKMMFVIPLVVYAAMIPFLCALHQYKPNYDQLGLSGYDGIPETEAYNKMTDHFGASKSVKFMFIIKANELGPAHHGAALLQVDDEETASAQVQTAEEVAFAQHAMKMSRKANELHAKVGHGIVMEAGFGEEVCKFSEQLISIMKKNHYKMDNSKIENVWYGKDPFGKGKHGCRSQKDLATELQDADATFSDMFNDQVTADGSKLLLGFYPGVESMGERAQNLYHVLRDTLEPQAAHEFEMNGKRYWFNAKHTSPISATKENGVAMKRIAPWVMILTAGLAFVGVALMFKAIFLPIKFFMTVIFPIAAVCGMAVAVFQLNWFDWLGCDSLAKDGGVCFTIFYSCIGLMFGLAMDYDIFLFARVYEYRMEGYDNVSAVQKGVVETGPVITSAGCFMLMSFFFMMVCGIRVMMQMAFLYFFGVLIDTFIIRTCIAPSILCWGEFLNFWPGAIPPVTKSYNVDEDESEVAK